MEFRRKMAMAAGWDEANRNMRKNGRTAWTVEDRDIASATFHKIYPDEENLADLRQLQAACEAL